MLTIRIELEDVVPPVWREVEVPPDLTLDVLHRVVQGAMGWTDSHLHRFFLGEAWDPAATAFVTEADLAEGERGTLESTVRVGELLGSVGDALGYTYDFGDGWDHVLRLVGTTASPVGAVRCVAGERACPPEDCGGAPGYEELLRRSSTRRAAAERYDVGEAQELVELMLLGSDARWTAPRTGAGPGSEAPVPPPLHELLARASGPAHTAIEELVGRARLDRPVDVDAGTARRMVEPVAWMVRHIGVRGLPLTSAGYLRPVDVEAAAAALGIGDEWMGTLNREIHTVPVLVFRQALQRAGVLRVARGRVHATRTAARLVDDPVALWWHLAERLPIGAGANRDAGLLVLLELAGTDAVEPAREGPDAGGMIRVSPGAARVAAAMAGLGWARHDGTLLTAGEVHRLADLTLEVKRRCGAFVDVGSLAGRRSIPTPEGIALARAALQTWR